MLNIKEKESKNIVEIVGILKELDINEGTSKKSGKDYISATAKVVLDQDINGVATECVVPVRFFAMKEKADGSENKVYSRIQSYRENFTSISAAEDASKADRVKISGARISENPYVNQSNTLVEKNFVINGSFINKARETDVDGATFEVSGVVGKIMPEVDSEDNETGRLIVHLIIVEYNGNVSVLKMVAEGPAKAHIEQNWNQGDTVNANGIINMCASVKTITEEQGFGPPLVKKQTTYRQELVIIGGSGTGLDEAYSYDGDDIRVALSNRTAKLNELKENVKSSNSTPKAAPKKGFEF